MKDLLSGFHTHKADIAHELPTDPESLWGPELPAWTKLASLLAAVGCEHPHEREPYRTRSLLSRGRTSTFLMKHGWRWIRETHQMRSYAKRHSGQKLHELDWQSMHEPTLRNALSCC